jgi:sulfur-carrier protein adenylyltransferase/sulfurtransferase
MTDPTEELRVPSGVPEDLPGLSAAETLRYARHLVLDEVGEAGQVKLKAARVLIVGAGGLGSPAALYLAAAGVGTLGLVDFDAVDATNLQRQVLYGQSDLGRPKLDAALDRLGDMNPHVRLVAHTERLTSENALRIIADYDIVVDGTDNFPTRYLVNDACVLLGKRNVYGSILKFEGQLSVFAGGNDAPCYRCLFRQPPPPGLVPSCAEGGVLGVLPGIVGSLQALEAIKLITGAGEPMIGRLLLFDALKLRWRELKLRRNPECPVCGDEPSVTALIDYDVFCGVAPDPSVPATQHDSVPFEMDVLELKDRLDRGEALDLVDVREPYEWRIGNLEPYGAKLIPLRDLEARLGELDPEREIVLYCRSGARSGDLGRYLRAHGYPRVRNLEGGILAWSEKVDSSIPRY